MTKFIELTPSHSYLLLRAREYEISRDRNEKGNRRGQVNRDIRERDAAITKAVDQGVPVDQAERFVYRESDD